MTVVWTRALVVLVLVGALGLLARPASGTASAAQDAGLPVSLATTDVQGPTELAEPDEVLGIAVVASSDVGLVGSDEVATRSDDQTQVASRPRLTQPVTKTTAPDTPTATPSAVPTAVPSATTPPLAPTAVPSPLPSATPLPVPSATPLPAAPIAVPSATPVSAAPPGVPSATPVPAAATPIPARPLAAVEGQAGAVAASANSSGAASREQRVLASVGVSPASLGYTISFHPYSGGYRGLTFTDRGHIDIYVRGGQSDSELAYAIAHELGHAADHRLNDLNDRARWREVRGMNTDLAWWPTAVTNDFMTPAGDFAECFASWLVGSPSHSAWGGCAGALPLMAELVNG